MKLAYFSPLPPDRSGIADYSADLLPHLANFADIVLFVEDPKLLPENLRGNFRISPLFDFPKEHKSFDMVLYQMGNSEYHEAFYPLMVRYPGIVDLHDYYLHHFTAHRTLGQKKEYAYARELVYSLGEEGYYLAGATARGERSLPFYELPLNDRILDSSLGLIVHSKYVRNLVHQGGYNRPIHVIPQIMEQESGQSRRNQLGLTPDNLVFASLGLISPAKQIELFLNVFSRLRETHSQAHFILVGEALPDADPDPLIQQLGLDDVVHQIGYVPHLNDFLDWLKTADVIINLRYPTAGETSASALRAMAAGKPVVVFDHGWYAEIAEGSAVKVPVMDEDALLSELLHLSESEEYRQQIGGHAERVTREENNAQSVSEAYYSAIQHTLNFIWQSHV